MSIDEKAFQVALGNNRGKTYSGNDAEPCFRDFVQWYEAAKVSEQPVDWAYIIERAYISGPAEHAFDEFLLKAGQAHTIDIHMRGDGKDFYCQGDFLKYAKKSRNFLAQSPKRESVDEGVICSKILEWLKEGEEQFDKFPLKDKRKAHPNTLRGYIQIIGWVQRDLRVALNRTQDLLSKIEGEKP